MEQDASQNTPSVEPLRGGLQAVAENAWDAIVVIDLEGRIRFWNEGAQHIFGHSKSAAIGTDVHDLLAPAEYEDRIEDGFETFVETGTGRALGRTLELRATHRDGSRIPVELSVNAYEDDGDRYAVAIVRDVTERTERKRELERFHAFVEQSRDLITVIDENGHIQYNNSTVEAMLGYEQGELVGEDPLQYVHPDDREEVAAQMAALVAESGPGPRVEFRFHHADGSWVWLESVGSNRLDNPSVQGIVVNQRDITTRKDRQRKLEQYEYTIENAGEWIVAVDAEGSLVFANEGFREHHGLPDDVKGMTLDAILDPSTIEEIQPWIQRALNGDSVTFEHQTTPIDGAAVPVRSIVFPLEDPGGEIIGVVAAIRDISEVRARDQQLQVVDRVLRHNVNNSMNVVLGYAETIREHTTDDRVCQYANAILDRGEDLVSTARKEREITRILSKTPRRRPTNLTDLIEATVSSITAEHPAVTIEVDSPADCTVTTTTRLIRAIEELITNAVTHCDRDQPEVVVGVDCEPETVAVSVADDGPGIPAMDQNILRIDQDIEPLYHGSGLGLWLVKLIVDRADGALTFDEKDPRGSVVTITLPRR
ncbi:REC domain [Halanaeroarchaeum sp. HSR-CO]|uniref:PAS domain-containing protein n=1 Tax=Halanaeroarchaeum sp. HSR-CO TaxID=2866382 RepID=UPI00217D2E4F|nr:PAS domain S-box protein [Halanaeroarchaeum sp. HSR-CO]UWG46761.1 REC domain [Halanaeroarchaeum sp. HSR-CO]